VSGGLNDPVVARLRSETETELHIRAVIEALHEQGIRASDIRCVCCQARLVDLAHITVTARGPLCLECIEKSTTDYTPAQNEA
jgi:recombinational DNA repair protein (RecF pathway)